MARRNYDVVGAIDVGTNHLHLTVAQINNNGKMDILEDLTLPTNIGNDAFTFGRISTSTMRATTESLLGFVRILKEYKVKHYRSFAKSALREASNREYVLEFIRMKTGLSVEVINSAQERFYLYKALKYHNPDFNVSHTKESTLVVNISSGGLEISVFNKGNLSLTEYINIGSLRIFETLSEFRTKKTNYYQMIEDYINSELSLLYTLLHNADIQNMIGLGSEINTIYHKLTQKDLQLIDRDHISRLYDNVCKMHDDQLKETYELTPKQLETFVPSVIILNALLKVTKTKRVFIPLIVFRYGVIYDLADHIYNCPRREDFEKDIIHSIWYIAKKYGTNEKHCEQVAKLALAIFDQTMKLHKLSEKERQYLHIAAILHDIGYFVNFSEHHRLSYELIKKQNIMGLSNLELDIIANVVRYQGTELPGDHDLNQPSFTHKYRMIISKLAVLLKMADSLDISHEDKIQQLDISINKDSALFKLYSRQSPLLEEWAFAKVALFFEAIMGVSPATKHIFH
ncbi:HD domain-containing protein [Dehalobacter sp. DCM]|uniref:Ppx/GppA phosphatase family protein n=1 Tax=Dehalobacter sp. DCM TaxID=2907827 RepID=UPI003081A023|nr:HD domain-containing protein [Dehalobacter sp. DCM]